MVEEEEKLELGDGQPEGKLQKSRDVENVRMFGDGALATLI